MHQRKSIALEYIFFFAHADGKMMQRKNEPEMHFHSDAWCGIDSSTSIWTWCVRLYEYSIHFSKSKIHLSNATSSSWGGFYWKYVQKYAQIQLFRITACIEYNHYSQNSMQHKSQANFLALVFQIDAEKIETCWFQMYVFITKYWILKKSFCFFVSLYFKQPIYLTNYKEERNARQIVWFRCHTGWKIEILNFPLKKAISSCVLCFYHTVS